MLLLLLKSNAVVVGRRGAATINKYSCRSAIARPAVVGPSQTTLRAKPNHSYSIPSPTLVTVLQKNPYDLNQTRSFSADAQQQPPQPSSNSRPYIKPEEEPKETRLSRSLRFARTKPGMIAIGGTVFALFVGRIVYDVTSAFIHLDFYTVAEVGFVAGLATASSGFAFITYFNRIRSIDVERVITDALDMVQRSPKVAEVMGLSGFTFSTVQTGTIRTYQIEGGHFATSRSSGFPVWKKPKVQVMFQVWGGSNEKQGIVVAEAFTDYNAQRKFTFVSFDLLQGRSGFQGDNPTVIVYGDESLMKVRNDMRSFVTLNRVYVRGLE